MPNYPPLSELPGFMPLGKPDSPELKALVKQMIDPVDLAAFWREVFTELRSNSTPVIKGDQFQSTVQDSR